MNYDQHYPGGDAGAVAGQDWFVKNLQDALKVIPKEKIICAVGNYGYDWAMKKGQKKGTPPEDVHNVSVQEAWLEASDAETDVNFDDDAMNPHFAYLDDNNVRHDVWFLDGVTALNQMRSGACAGHRYLRAVAAGFGRPLAVGGVGQAVRGRTRPPSSSTVPPGQDVDIEGAGRDPAHSIASPRPANARSQSIPTPTWSATRSSRTCPCRTWSTCTAARRSKKVAITFDDGPDPEWTPKILDVLKEKGVKATFFLIGARGGEVSRHRQAGLQRRPRDRQPHLHPSRHQQHFEALLRSGAEPDRAALREQARREAGADAAAVRHRSKQPDTADQVRPLELAQDLGYITVGEKIDPNDWRDNPRRSANEIADDVLANLPPCAPGNLRCGNIILLHDGGGDRSQTVKALRHDPRRPEGARLSKSCRSPS